MRRAIRVLSCSVILACFSARAAEPIYPAVVNRFDDQAQMLPKEGWQAQRDDLIRRLEQFEQKTGIRIVVQFHAKSPPDDIDKVPGAYMSALSTQMGLIDHGILVVYFADDPDWRVWFGNEVAPTFVGKPEKTAKELTADGSIHTAKEAFLDACGKKADAAVKDSEPSVNKQIALTNHAVDEGIIIANELMKRLGPKP